MFGKVNRRIAIGGIAIAACAALFLCACFPSGGSGGGSSWRPPYFDGTGFYEQDGRYYYELDSAAAAKTGIDVSDNQGWIDWDAVASDSIQFAMIRAGFRGATEGSLFPDDYFEYNLSAAQAVGLECGVYFFSQAVNVEEAEEEARYVLSLLDGVELDYPVAYDFEVNAAGIDSRAEGITGEQATANARAFCAAIQDAGYDAMVYGNNYDLALYDSSLLSDYPLWYAEYGSAPMCRQAFRIWQYRSDGQVAGIETAVDLNLDMSSAL